MIVQLELAAKLAGQLFVCVKSPFTRTPLMLKEALPLLVTVTDCAALEEPTATLANVRFIGASVTPAAVPMPLRAMDWVDPVASSWITIDPERVPAVVGVKVTEIMQLLAAATPGEQLSISLKSPVAVIEVIDSAALPMLRSRTVCAWLAVPTGRLANVSELGLSETAAADAAPIFITKASVPPPSTVWNAPDVVGKSAELVDPAT